VEGVGPGLVTGVFEGLEFAAGARPSSVGAGVAVEGAGPGLVTGVFEGPEFAAGERPSSVGAGVAAGAGTPSVGPGFANDPFLRPVVVSGSATEGSPEEVPSA